MADKEETGAGEQDDVSFLRTVGYLILLNKGDIVFFDLCHNLHLLGIL